MEEIRLTKLGKINYQIRFETWNSFFEGEWNPFIAINVIGLIDMSKK